MRKGEKKWSGRGINKSSWEGNYRKHSGGEEMGL